MYKKLVAKFIMAFGSPELAGNPDIVFTVDNLKKSEFHCLNHELQLALYQTVSIRYTFLWQFKVP